MRFFPVGTGRGKAHEIRSKCRNHYYGDGDVEGVGGDNVAEEILLTGWSHHSLSQHHR